MFITTLELKFTKQLITRFTHHLIMSSIISDSYIIEWIVKRKVLPFEICQQLNEKCSVELVEINIQYLLLLIGTFQWKINNNSIMVKITAYIVAALLFGSINTERLLSSPSGNECLPIPNNSIFGSCNGVFGDLNKLEGNRNIVYGSVNTLSGCDNGILGSYNTLKGNKNLINGYVNSVYGSKNFVDGNYNTAVGSCNEVGGDQNIVGGDDNFVKGNGNTVISSCGGSRYLPSPPPPPKNCYSGSCYGGYRC